MKACFLKDGWTEGAIIETKGKILKVTTGPLRNLTFIESEHESAAAAKAAGKELIEEMIYNSGEYWWGVPAERFAEAIYRAKKPEPGARGLDAVQVDPMPGFVLF